MYDALKHAAPLQGKLAGLPWQVVNSSGFVIAHCKSYRQARDTAEQVSGTIHFNG
jgi:hypothetical protein